MIQENKQVGSIQPQRPGATRNNSESQRNKYKFSMAQPGTADFVDDRCMGNGVDQPLCMHHDNNVNRTRLQDATPNKPRKVSSGSELQIRVEKVGTVRVDSGALVIVDPFHGEDVPEEHDDLDDIISQGGSKRLDDANVFVWSKTGFGDGRYPVFATIVDDPHKPMGNREWVAALHIPFLPPITFGEGEAAVREAENDFVEFLKSELAD